MDFRKHLMAGLAGGFLVSLSLTLFDISDFSLVLGFFVFVLSSIFPDIDHHKSVPRKGFRFVVFLFLLAMTIYFSLTFFSGLRIVIASTLVIPVVGYCLIEQMIPRHRGVMHSYAFLLVYALIVGVIFRLLGFKAKKTAITMVCCGLGYLTHLILDRIWL